MPLPAVSDGFVALAYQTRRGGASTGAEAAIVFLDKHTGKKVNTLSFHDGPFPHSSRLALRGLGEALFVLGQGAPPRGTGLEILETLR
jgi:hypothetical protein